MTHQLTIVAIVVMVTQQLSTYTLAYMTDSLLSRPNSLDSQNAIRILALQAYCLIFPDSPPHVWVYKSLSAGWNVG